MLNSFFSNSEHDLNGHDFKHTYEQTAKAQLIDVRTRAEVASGTIVKAINIDVMSVDFATRIKKLNPDNTYFVFCRSGARSANAVKQLRAAGFIAYNLVGGIGSWPR